MKVLKYTKLVLAMVITQAFLLQSCKDSDTKADGYGNFEANAVTVSSESNGKLLAFDVEEGQHLAQGKLIGYTDTIPLQLKIDQLLGNKPVIEAKKQGVSSQIAVLKAQIRAAEVSKKRIVDLLSKKLATPAQLDDVNGKLDVLKQQIKSVRTQIIPFEKELSNIDIQVQQLKEQIKKTKIINPMDGTVLVKYAEPNEVTAFGKPLYKIADISTMQLRVYVSETQLPEVKLGQEVTVKIDAGEGMKNYRGIVRWIAAEAEFTPKIIQTKEERVNLVYAVKIDVANDGGIKIGMPGEMWLNSSDSKENNASEKN